MQLITLYTEFAGIVTILLNAYTWIILAYCLVSMIVGFGIIDIQSNRFLQGIFSVLVRLVEPALRPIQNILPNTGMMDFSTIILLLIIEYVIPFILKGILQLLLSSQGL